MQQIIKTILVMMISVCMALSIPSSGQSFSKLFDFDSLSDGGSTVLLKPDSSYIVFGFSGNKLGRNTIGTMTISNDGNQLINKKEFDFNLCGIFLQSAGRVKRQDDSTYYSNIIFQGYSAAAQDNYFSMGGFVKFNALGDTVLYRIYNDTLSLEKEFTFDCIRLSNGKFFLAGYRHLYGGYDSAFLRCLDNSGNLLWTRAYKKKIGDNSFQSLEQLPDGRILAGAYIESYAVVTLPTNPNYYDYYIKRPWFMIMDTLGNMLKDTLYDQNAYNYNSSKSYIGGGNIFLDKKNGGYYHWGIIDSFFTLNPNNGQNQPTYVAHVDTNFRFTWKHILAEADNRNSIINVKQLSDGNLLVLGYYGGGVGKAIKMSSANGNTIWSHLYFVDSFSAGYFTDAVELPNKDIVFTGQNSSKNTYHSLSDDVWLLRVDSSGCEIPGCYSTAVPHLTSTIDNDLKIFPNPTTGRMTVTVKQAGSLMVIDIQGKVVSTCKINGGNTEISMPDNATDGLYIGRYTSSDGKEQRNVKINYQR